MKSKIRDLPSGIGVCRVNNGSGREYWRVRLGKKFTGGQTVIRVFDKLDDARTWIFGDAQKEKSDTIPLIELKQASGASAFLLSPAQLGEAVAAFRRLEGWNMSLTEAVELAEKFRTPDSGTLSVKEAIEKCAGEKLKLKRSTHTLYDLKTRWKRFSDFLPAAKQKAVHSITTEDVERFVKSCKLAPLGQRNMVRALSSLFSWCVSAKVMPANPALKWDFSEAKKVLARDREPRILTITEAENILRIAAAGQSKVMEIGKQPTSLLPGEMIPFVTIGLFAGLRPFEARRFRWEWIWWGDAEKENHDPHFDVPASITKTGHARHVPIEPVVAEWLLPYKKESGLLVPPAFERKFAMFSKLCWKEAGWPEDVLRHSYASYLLARDKNAGAVAENLGHRETTSTLFRYYRKAVKFRADVVAYWALTPDKISDSADEKIVNFAA